MGCCHSSAADPNTIEESPLDRSNSAKENQSKKSKSTSVVRIVNDSSPISPSPSTSKMRPKSPSFFSSKNYLATGKEYDKSVYKKHPLGISVSKEPGTGDSIWKLTMHLPDCPFVRQMLITKHKINMDSISEEEFKRKFYQLGHKNTADADFLLFQQANAISNVTMGFWAILQAQEIDAVISDRFLVLPDGPHRAMIISSKQKYRIIKAKNSLLQSMAPKVSMRCRTLVSHAEDLCAIKDSKFVKEQSRDVDDREYREALLNHEEKVYALRNTFSRPSNREKSDNGFAHSSI